jgi:PAS domain S-box-containing protein
MSPIHDSRNETASSANDSTPKIREQLENEKKISEDLMEILEGSYDGILVTDGEGNVLYVNNSYERIAEIKLTDLIGRNMKELINPVWMPNSVAFVVAEQRQSVSKRQITKSGKNIIVTGRPVFDRQGSIKKIVINVRDITEIYELREELLISRTREQILASSYDFSGMIAKGEHKVIAVSEPMKSILNTAEKIANFQTTVLVTGESGVGKEEVAKYIHKKSLRKEKPFITINCGAIPQNLLESELFGYEKFAFTGASQKGKTGLLELANGGSVFLDEIGETSLDFQVKLLRVLESKELRRVGGSKDIEVDIRIIAATNKTLEDMVESGSFREDLYYRLNVVQLHIPPLRKRTDDIEPLARLFTAHFNNKYQQNKSLTMDVIQEFIGFTWPGNVRQLKNVIENMIILSNNDYLQQEDIPWLADNSRILRKNTIKAITANDELSLSEAVENLEKLMLEQAKARYRTTRDIASALKVDQSTIVRKMKKYGI